MAISPESCTPFPYEEAEEVLMNCLFSNQKPYLLEPHVLVDSPLPIFKSIGQLLSENAWELLAFF